MKQLSVYLIFVAGLALLPTSIAQAAKCLLVMSYHQGYAWNDGVQKGVESVLQGKCELKIFYMDTKRHKSKEHAIAKAIEASKLVEQYRPDVLIASDDHASKYLVSKYYKNADLPIVFCAVNWDVSKYGYPYKNVTGMIEVAPIQPLIEVSRKNLPQLKNVFYLGVDTLSETKNAHRVAAVLQKQGILTSISLAKDLGEWKSDFIKAQQADLIILGSNAGLAGWDNREMIAYTSSQARKLIVTNHSWMAPYSMYAMTKIAEEQGEWAAEAALAIIKGLPPAKIPIRVNRKWKTFINTPLLSKAGIHLDVQSLADTIEVGGQTQVE